MANRITTLLVANRGEIAVRIIRAAKELGIRTVAVYSQADKDSLHVRLADTACDIGPAHASKSYLNIQAILEAARQTNADAVHPGYGFLAENEQFARQVAEAGMVFVGPGPETIRLMGDKARARETAIKAGVPTVPGSDGVVADVTVAAQIADRIGYPVMIKAAAGGGGRGIRVVHHADELEKEFIAAQREGLGAFGDGSVYLEKFIARARHIEVQVLGDGSNVIHCFERECSLQRRRQKVFEEAPSPVLSEERRQALCTSAVALAKSVNYSGAGTLEYLYDDASGEFYFIEMNTRIQVEHPITEMITGIDLVRTMLRIANGEPLPYRQHDITRRGSAIECRINAEDPAKGFFPTPGKLQQVTLPAGPGIRVDSMIYPGYTVPPYYDSMLAKLIVWDETREQALARLARALDEVSIEGIATTVPLHQALVRDQAVQQADYHTGFLEQWMVTHPLS